MFYPINKTHYYYIWDIKKNCFVDFFSTEQEFIYFLSTKYRHQYNCEEDKWYLKNYFINRCTCNYTHPKSTDEYVVFDGYNRIINVAEFSQKALEYYNKRQDKIRYASSSIFNTKMYLNCNFKFSKDYYKIHFRKEPIPYTRKWRGGQSSRNLRLFRIKKMYSNLEYKEFNRGSKDDYIQEWDRNRIVQKSWKTQTKARHQWEKHLK